MVDSRQVMVMTLVMAEVQGDWGGNMFLLGNSSLWRLSCLRASYPRSESGGAHGVLEKKGDMLATNCTFAFCPEHLRWTHTCM